MRRAPASSAFSTSSFTAAAGRSMTSPAAIWLASVSGRTWMRTSRGVSGIARPALKPVVGRPRAPVLRLRLLLPPVGLDLAVHQARLARSAAAHLRGGAHDARGGGALALRGSRALRRIATTRLDPHRGRRLAADRCALRPALRRPAMGDLGIGGGAVRHLPRLALA